MEPQDDRLNLTENARTVLAKRYLKKDENGRPVERPEDMFRRVANNIAQADRYYDKGADVKKTEDKFYDMMKTLEFLPNSPTLMNAGRDLQQLSACYVLPIDDSMEGIFETLKNASLIHKGGGGTGFSFSRLRPKGSTVKSTSGVASGPVSFMKVYDSATQAVKQGGTRRGANMGILRVDHPDILEFIKCKEDDKSITNFNISVTVTEDFMRRVKSGEDYDLKDPHNAETVGRLNAKEVFDLIVKQAHKNGEPGIIFIDEMNKFNPTPKLGMFESTNPCGEQNLLPYESCMAKDTRITTDRGAERIGDLCKRQEGGDEIFIATQGESEICFRPAMVIYTGKKPVLRVTLANGRSIRLTEEHKVKTDDGFKEVKDLKINKDKIVIQNSELPCRCERNERSERSEAISSRGHLKRFWGYSCDEIASSLTLSAPRNDNLVVSIEPDGVDDVYDIFEPATHTLIAEGMIIHNCNLGSINLSKTLIEKNGKIQIDWPKLRQTTHDAAHFLDNVIDMNKYPIKQIEAMTKGNRKVGLGVMGWADMLIQIGIPYNSDEAVDLAKKVMKFIWEEAVTKSQRMAEKRGAFPNFKDSVFAGGKKRRNATVTTIAPTGTLSIIAGCSSGIEPLFAICFYRKVLDGAKLIDVNPHFEKIARQRGFYGRQLMEKISARSSIQDIEEIPEDVRRFFVTSHDIYPIWHIKMQAAFQNTYTENAVSKTVNFPNDATPEEVREVYMLAHQLGCKGVTIYRDGSRQEQVLNIDRKAPGAEEKNQRESTEAMENKQKEERIREQAENALEDTEAAGERKAPRPRPRVVTGTTTKVQTGCGNLYVTINVDEQGKPFEVFTQMGKAGGCAASQLEAVGRLVSLALRSDLDIKSIIEQLQGIRCPSPSWEKTGRIFSCADAIAKVVERRLLGEELREGEGTEQAFDSPMAHTKGTQEPNETSARAAGAMITKKWTVVGVCPDCGGALVHEEGCMKCHGCGYTKC